MKKISKLLLFTLILGLSIFTYTTVSSSKSAKAFHTNNGYTLVVPASFFGKVGDTGTIPYTIKPCNVPGTFFVSKTPSVITVTSNGQYKFVGKGIGRIEVCNNNVGVSRVIVVEGTGNAICPPPTPQPVNPRDYLNSVDLGGSNGHMVFYFSAKQKIDYMVEVYRDGAMILTENFPSARVVANGTTWATPFNPGFMLPTYSDGALHPTGKGRMLFKFYGNINGQKTLLFTGNEDTLLLRGPVII